MKTMDSSVLLKILRPLLSKKAFVFFVLPLGAVSSASADIFIANPFSEPHCFHLSNAQTTKQAADFLISAYGKEAKIVGTAKNPRSTEPNIYVEIPGSKTMKPYPVIVIDGTRKDCEVLVESINRQLKSKSR